MANRTQLKGSLDLAQMNHNAFGTDQTAAALEAAQEAYDGAVAAANDVPGGIVDSKKGGKATVKASTAKTDDTGAKQAEVELEKKSQETE